jgi:hypothetical protein
MSVAAGLSDVKPDAPLTRREWFWNQYAEGGGSNVFLVVNDDYLGVNDGRLILSV